MVGRTIIVHFYCGFSLWSFIDNKEEKTLKEYLMDYFTGVPGDACFSMSISNNSS